MSDTNKKVAVGYMRYSSNAQNDGFSLEAQEKAIRKYVEDHDLYLKTLYYDKAKTGTNAKRPYFQQMMADAEKQLFEMVIVHKGDRFSRKKLDAVHYKSKLKELGIQLISITEDFGNEPAGVIMESLSEGLAEYYSLNLSREVKKGMDIVASKGLHTGGRPPLGYDVSLEKKLVINPVEAEVVRFIFQHYANGWSYNEIIKELNVRGYKTKNENTFSASSLYSIITQRKYIGEYVYGRRAPKNINGSQNSHKNNPEEEIIRIPGGVPRIIDNETFEKVQIRVQGNKRKQCRYRPDSSYLLTGLIVCGECGQHYQGNCRSSGRGNSNRYSSYRCGHRQNHKSGCKNGEIEKNRLENFVLEQIQEYFFDENSVHTIVSMLNEYQKEVQKNNSTDSELYQKQLKEIESQIKNVTQAISNGAVEDIFIQKINELHSAKKDIEQRIHDASNSQQIQLISEDEVKASFSKFKEHMKANNFPECKRFINQYIDKVIVHTDKVEVVFKVASTLSLHNDTQTAPILHIHIVISRKELKFRPKQRRKIVPTHLAEKRYLTHYEILSSENQIVKTLSIEK